MEKNKSEDTSTYINELSAPVGICLEKLRNIIQQINPDAVESISYGMPAFRYKGKPLVYFAAFKNHIGFYPTGSTIKAFEHELTEFRYSKGAIQFPHGSRLPISLIKRMIKFKSKEIDVLLLKKQPR